MVFVLGSSGFVGANLCSCLLKQKISCLGFDILEKDNSEVQFLKFDVTNQRLKSIREVPETLVLLSGVSSHPAVVKNRAQAIQTNLLSISDIVQDFIEMGGKHVIFASSEWVYSKTQSGLLSTDPRHNPSPYGRQKLYGEIFVQELCEAAKIEFTNLRFGIIWGNRVFGSAIESITNSLISNRNSIEISHLETGRRFVHVNDICSAIVGVIKNRPVGTFDIQGAEIITMEKIINAVTNKVGIKDISIHELNTQPDDRYLNEDQICDLPFEWRVGNFSRDITDLISKVHHL